MSERISQTYLDDKDVVSAYDSIDHMAHKNVLLISEASNVLLEQNFKIYLYTARISCHC